MLLVEIIPAVQQALVKQPNDLLSYVLREAFECFDSDLALFAGLTLSEQIKSLSLATTLLKECCYFDALEAASNVTF